MNRVRRGEMPGRSAFRGLIFDLDGTIADTEEVHRRAFNQAFAEHGLPWAWSPAEYAGLLSISGGRERSCGMRGSRYRRRSMEHSSSNWPAGSTAPNRHSMRAC